MTAVLYQWPSAAAFGRTVPKAKFYEQGVVSAAVKKRFVADVEAITWAYKLAESTIHLPASSDVQEIEVLRLRAKAEDVHDSVLAAIDKAIAHPVIFEIVSHHGTRMTTAPAAGGSGGRYYTTQWLRDDARGPLPTCISLSALYAALIDPLVPTTILPGERLSDVADRLTTISRLEREVSTLERKLGREPQLNRKVELRRTLKSHQATLVDLKNPTTSTTS